MDALAFSSLWVAAAAGALAIACSLAMGIPPPTSAVGLAFCGTFLVYNIDRLRDLDRDRSTSPLRSEFVEDHAALLTLLSLVAGLASAGFALAAGVAAWFLLLPALALGLLHRRIKHIPFGKSVYITVCWLAVVVGLPVAIDAGVRHVGWVLAITASAVFANAVASNLRHIDVAAAHFGSGPALGAARSCAMIGSALALVAPAAVRPLVAVPLATLLVLISFRRGERYGLVAVDGALLVGAMVAIIASQL